MPARVCPGAARQVEGTVGHGYNQLWHIRSWGSGVSRTKGSAHHHRTKAVHTPGAQPHPSPSPDPASPTHPARKGSCATADLCHMPLSFSLHLVLLFVRPAAPPPPLKLGARPLPSPNLKPQSPTCPHGNGATSGFATSVRPC